jgi:signal transduction histidine kinase
VQSRGQGGSPDVAAGLGSSAVAARSAGSGGRLLRNWRVRSRLVLLIAIPTATAAALGGISIAGSWQSAVAYQRIARLAALSGQVTKLAYGLELERDETVTYIALGPGGRAGVLGGLLKIAKPTPAQANNQQTAQAQLRVVTQATDFNSPLVASVRSGVLALGSGFPASVTEHGLSVLTELDSLASLRSAALHTSLPAIEVINNYRAVISQLLSFDDQITLTSSDQQLGRTEKALGEISRIEQEYSVQRAIVMYALTANRFAPGLLGALNASLAELQADYTVFQNFATLDEQSLYTNKLNAASLIDRVRQYEQSVISGHSDVGMVGIAPMDWFGAMNSTLAAVRSVEKAMVAESVTRAQQLRKNAIISAAVIGGAVLLVLVLSLIFTVIVGRSMVRPLRRLRTGALEVAGIRLPETVRRMSESDGENVPIDVDPIDVDSLDEIGEVARAFDQVHREALRLAANEAALRGNVNAMFVNLSRRSQSLVERQIRLIDDLEQGEQDAERLGSLFQMDHLATRMRRNSENLLVLAGHESSRRWNQPVPLVDVLRAAISEIEQYERVTLNVQPGIAVRGPAVNDVVHLIAELAENATSFSSADTPVSVSGHLLSSGGVLLDITDEGVGMGAEEMAHANWRLDNPPVVDVAVSRRMGLFVVARLAARHGVRVRLRPASGTGLTALVWLPDEVVVRDTAGKPAGFGPLAEHAFRVAIGPGGPASPGDLVDPSLAPGVAETAGLAGEWTGAAGRTSTEDEVAAARAPRFTAAQAEGGNGTLGPPRVPGAGPHPGQAGITSTGPIPAMAPDSAPDSAAASASSPTISQGQPELGIVRDGSTGPLPAFGTGEWSTPSSESADAAAVLGAPVAEARQASGSFRIQSFPLGSAAGEVIVPPATSLREENRLPIFEAVESDWFRRGRPSVDLPSSKGSSIGGFGWASPGDAGWRAAEAAAVPSSGGMTLAGLPRRVPQANLVPGTAAESPAPASTPVRSASATRERFASLQRGIREGRAAASENVDGTDEVPGDG